MANDKPLIATDNGGVVGESGITYDQNGSATGQIGKSLTQSWTGNQYQLGSIEYVYFRVFMSAVSYAAAQGGNPSGNRNNVRSYTTPQQAMYTLSKANLESPACDALLNQFANMAHIPQAMLIAQLQKAANAARIHTYDGPSSTVPLDPIKFPGIASSGIATVGQWFNAPPRGEGLSQFNGDAVWVSLDDWHNWIPGAAPLTQMIFHNGKVNYYGMGTLMHEILHKQAVGGGFTHPQMNTAITAVGWPLLTGGHEIRSEAIGKFCFGNLQ